MSGWTEKTTAEVRRQASHKVAAVIVGPIPAKLTDAYKKKFIEVVDWLCQDVEDAQPVLQSVSESASISEPTSNGGTPTLDEAISLTDSLREWAHGDQTRQNKIKLAFVSLGVKNPKSLEDAVSSLNQEQYDKMKTLVETGTE